MEIEEENVPDVEDMISLADLSEASILANLGNRYANKQKIYTFTGSILVALNPYCRLDIYGRDFMKKYRRHVENAPPHIFAIAETAFSNLKRAIQTEDVAPTSQSIIISGESGSGKTESTKLILEYLTSVSQLEFLVHKQSVKGNLNSFDGESWINEQIIVSNRILEGFANAKTVRNNNSSRFGKLIKIMFNKHSRTNEIVGAYVENYLLEKSRVVRQAQNERNYHVFYELLAGTTAQEKQKYKLLQKSENYYYLNQSGCFDDRKNFEEMKLALNIMKMTPGDVDSIMRILSGILSLGNVDVLNASTTNANGQEVIQIQGKHLDFCKNACDLFSCDFEQFKRTLVFRKITVRNETTFVPFRNSQSADMRDAMAKAVYAKLFDFLVTFINNSMNQSVSENAGDSLSIGVLDIFGFEQFEVNSFEQLCINYANEKLHQLFINFVFKLELQEYAREVISVSDIIYKDNQPCLDLLESKAGVFYQLDEECKMPKGSDESFVTKLHELHAKNTNYSMKPRFAKISFSIVHYAGEVSYNISGFLDKNRDTVSEEVFELFGTSKNSLLKRLFNRNISEEPSSHGKAARKVETAGSIFRSQLSNLAMTLSNNTLHYVRCIKPNWEKQQFVFDDKLVLAQLKYSGMLETIKIRKSGFPVRFTYEEFVDRFYALELAWLGSTAKEKSMAILVKYQVEKNLWQLGKTKMFLKQNLFDDLSAENSRLVSEKAVLIQKVYKGYRQRLQFRTIKLSAVVLQKYARRFLERSRYIRMKSAAVTIQAHVRGWFARDYAKRLRFEKKKKEEQVRREALANMTINRLAKRQEEEDFISQMAKMQLKSATSESTNNMTMKGGLAQFLDRSKGMDMAQSSLSLPKSIDINLTTERGEFTYKDYDTLPSPVAIPNRTSTLKFDTSKLLKELDSPELTSIMASNPLMRSNIQLTDEDISFKAYATKNFNLPRSGELNSSVRSLDNNAIENLVMYSSHIITYPLTKILSKFNPIAVDAFKELQNVLNSGFGDGERIMKLADLGLKYPEIKDELYVQLCKQLSLPELRPDNWDEILRNGFEIMEVYCSLFTPTKSFYRHFLEFLKNARIQGETNELCASAAYCEYCVKKVMGNGPRKTLPSIFEVETSRSHRPLFLLISLLDYTECRVKISHVSTFGEIMNDLALQIGLRDTSGWAIYEEHVDSDEICVLKHTDYIFDAITKWQETSTMKSFLIGNDLAIQGTEMCHLVFKRRLFYPSKLFTDSAAFNLTYYQLFHDLMSGLYPINDKMAFKLSGLVALIEFGDYDKQNTLIYNDISKFIPKQLHSHLPEEQWKRGIIEYHKVMSRKRAIKAKVMYIDALSHYPFFSSTFFKAKYKGFWQHSQNVLLGISYKRLYILLKDMTIIDRFTYSEISQLKENNGSISFAITRTSAEPMVPQILAVDKEPEKFCFEVKNSRELYALARDYAGATEKVESVRNDGNSTSLSTQDIPRLDKKVLQQRVRILIEGLVPIPSSFLTTMHSMCSSSRNIALVIESVMESKRPIDVSDLVEIEVLKLNEFWSKIMYETAYISTGDDGDVFDIITMIREYSGFEKRPTSLYSTGNVSHDTSMIFNILKKIEVRPELIDELYLQLFKFIDYCALTKPQALVKLWKLCVVTAACLKSRREDISEYVSCFLERACVPNEDIEDLSLRSEIETLANYCYKLYKKARSSSFHRKHTLSTAEVTAALHQKNPVAKIVLPDMQSRSVFIDHVTDANQLLMTIQSKLGIKIVTGKLGLFEIHDNLERCLSVNEMICDVFAEWEMLPTNVFQNPPKLLLKFRLFLATASPAADQTEENFLRFQAINDIVSGKYPVSLPEAMFLAGLIVQSNEGNFNSDNPKKVNYESAVSSYIPMMVIELMKNQDNIKKLPHDLKKEHQSLHGKSREECNKLFMKTIRESWELYGSTVYIVSQNYSNELPPEGWLVVHKSGIYLNQIYSRESLMTISYTTILNVNFDAFCLMIVTLDGLRYVFQTKQGEEIAVLVSEYRQLGEVSVNILTGPNDRCKKIHFGMTIFQVHEWWSGKSVGSHAEEFDPSAFCVVKFADFPNDIIVTGSLEGVMRFFDPSESDQHPSLIAEHKLEMPILALEADLFLGDEGASPVLAILQSRRISFGKLCKDSFGFGFSVLKSVEFAEDDWPFNMLRIPSGSSFDYGISIVVQTFQGRLHVIREGAKFMEGSFPKPFTLPGPLVYHTASDSVITSNWKFQIQSFRRDRLFADNLIGTNKLAESSWTSDIGELALDLLCAPYIEGSDENPDLVVIGEYQWLVMNPLNGQLIHSQKFNSRPLAWKLYKAQQKKSNKHNLMIIDSTPHLKIYHGKRLVWTAQLSQSPCSLQLGSFKNSPEGMLTFMDPHGNLTVGYLGTRQEDLLTQINADKSNSGKGASSAVLNLKDIMKQKGRIVSLSISEVSKSDTSNIIVKFQVSNSSHEFVKNLHVFSNCNQSLNNNDTQILPMSFTTDSVPANGKTSGKLRIDAFEVRYPIQICVTYQRLNSIHFFESTSIPLQASLFATQESIAFMQSLNSLQISIPLVTNNFKISSIISRDRTFAFLNSQKTRAARIVNVSDSVVEIKGTLISDCWPFLKTILDYCSSSGAEPGASLSVESVKDLPLNAYQETLDKHFESRQKLIEAQDRVETMSNIFFECQKALLEKYQQKHPLNMDAYEVLFDRVHSKVMKSLKDLETAKSAFETLSRDLSAATLVILNLLKIFVQMSNEDYEILESTFCISVDALDFRESGWHETVDVAISQLLKTKLARSDKDRQVNLPALERMTNDCGRLKKHILLLFDRIIKARGINNE